MVYQCLSYPIGFQYVSIIQGGAGFLWISCPHDNQYAYARRSVLLPPAFFKPLLQRLGEELGERSSMIGFWIFWAICLVFETCWDQNSIGFMNIHAYISCVDSGIAMFHLKFLSFLNLSARKSFHHTPMGTLLMAFGTKEKKNIEHTCLQSEMFLVERSHWYQNKFEEIATSFYTNLWFSDIVSWFGLLPIPSLPIPSFSPRSSRSTRSCCGPLVAGSPSEWRRRWQRPRSWEMSRCTAATGTVKDMKRMWKQ